MFRRLEPLCTFQKARGLIEVAEAFMQADAHQHLIAQADEGRAQVAEHAQVIRRVVQQTEQVEQVLHFLPLGEARGRMVEVRNAPGAQCFLECTETRTCGVKNRDVGIAAGPRFAGLAVADLRVFHELGNTLRDVFPLAAAPHLLVAGLGRDPLDLADRGRAMRRECRVADAALTGCLLQRGAGLRHCEGADRIDEIDDAGLAAEIAAERQGWCERGEVGLHVVPDGDVGAAEPVDALLGVADQEQLGTRHVTCDRVRDVPLRAVRVLELVDDEDAVAPANRVQGGAALRAGRAARGSRE